jgi:hypothetical protein
MPTKSSVSASKPRQSQSSTPDHIPAYCNWMPGDAAPAFDAGRGLFVEPYSPHQVIGVMHLAGREQKNHIFRLNRKRRMMAALRGAVVGR